NEMQDVEIKGTSSQPINSHEEKFKKPISKNSSIYKPPTNEEIQGIKETADLYQSNIFKLQIDELLSEINIDYNDKKIVKLEKALMMLKQIYGNINDIEDLSIKEVKDYMLNNHNIVIPFPDPQPSEDIQYKFGFKKPTAFYLVGSYALKNLAIGRNRLNVDFAVVMPKSIFQEKDYMNYRYFYKRAYYLSVLASALKKNSLDFNVKMEFDTLDGDRRRPILKLKAVKDHSETDFSKLNCVVRVLPCIPMDLFPFQRLSPIRNNIRFHNDQKNKNEKLQSQKSQTLPSTPQYNSAILKDMYYVPHLNFLYKQVKSCEAFVDACKLGKVWLQQRGFGTDDDGSNGFNGFIWTMLMAYLLTYGGGPNGGKRLSNGYSSYQLFKGTMDFLASHDFIKNPVFMNTSEKHEEIQYEAKLAMRYLNDTKIDRFEPLFLRKVDDVKLGYDNFAMINDVPKTYDLYTDSAKLDYPDRFVHFAKVLPNLLGEGLSDRVNLIAINYTKLPSWDISEQPKSFLFSKAAKLFIGLIFNLDQSNRLVDYGPSPEDIGAAAKFKKLWGKKAEIRRFKNGSILECVVWEPKGGIESRGLIVSYIVHHLLSLHYGIKQENKGIQYWASQFNEFVRLTSNVPKFIYNQDLSHQGFQPVMNAYDNLIKMLNSLEDLPLIISGIKSSSPALRYSTVFIPQATSIDYNYFIEPVEIIIEFEHSTKWPDELVAMQKMKTAFYLRIAEKIKTQYLKNKVFVLADNQDLIVSKGYIDIVIDGFVFRCRIQHEREMILLDQGIKNKKSSIIEKEAYTKALSNYKYLFIQVPSHSAQIQTLCNKNPSLSLTIRLAKRWFSVHLLSSHVLQEFIEILCAFVFLDSNPWSIPLSGFIGFIRVLWLISTWDWKNEPLIVNFENNGENETTKIINEIREKFKNIRQTDKNQKHASMFVASTTGNGTVWGWDRPSKVVAARIKDLAKSALICIDESIKNGDYYDILIYIDPSKCTRYYQNINPDSKYLLKDSSQIFQTYKVANNNNTDIIPMIGFDPIGCYVNELKKIYSEVALFFYDQYGGNIIGVVWNPSYFTPKPWKTNIEFSSILLNLVENNHQSENEKKSKRIKISKNGDYINKNNNNNGDGDGNGDLKMVILNTKAIAFEMGRLGEGLVERIEFQK
ncbi:12110_t:CDS:10, partial [Entrophospora sp. SA101]